MTIEGVVGRTPRSARVPPDPPSIEHQRPLATRRLGDQGVARGPGGPPHQRGSALLAVLWLSAALSAIAFAMSVTVRGEIDRTATSMDELRSYYLATAGVEKATMELLWTAEQGASYIPRNAAFVNYNFPSGIAHVEIIPEAAKLNVNRVSPQQLSILLSALGVEGGRANTIAAGILDWRGPTSGSAFDSYYLSLTPSFQAAHASLQEIEELLSVRGVTPDIFYGTWAPSGNGDAATNPLVRHAGLNDCLTVYGSAGTVDINTAEPAVLVAAGVSPAVIAAVVEQRAAGAGNQNLLEVSQSTGAVAALQAGVNAIVTFRSTARLRLPDGQLSDMRRTVGAQVRYRKWGSEIPYDVLRWYDTAWSY